MGRRGGLLSVLGNELGAVPLVVAVAFGVGAVVAESIALFTIVKLLGATYLVYLGVQAIRHRTVGVESAQAGPTARESARKTVAQGFVVGVTNPKTIVQQSPRHEHIQPRRTRLADVILAVERGRALIVLSTG